MNKLRVRLLVVGCAGLLLTLSAAGHAQETLPRFEPWDCLVDVPSNPSIECGYLVVPEDYDELEGSVIRLPVTIIRSRNQNPAPDPILYTDGGPGYSSLSSVWWLAGSEFLNDRDAVILEQRGNLYAQPSLGCDLSVWLETDPDHTPCLDSLKEKGIDLGQYTATVIAADIDALRQVLGYEEWNLYGSSYSTRLMQLTMHLHPEGIRSVILQSTSPLNDTRYEHDPEHAMRAVQVMFDDCATDSACAVAYPDLEAQLYRVIRKLNAEPVAFDFTDSETGEPYTEMVDGERLLGWMVTDVFYSPARPPYETAYMPLLIDQVDRGRTDLLLPWLDDELDGRYTSSLFAWGLYFAVNCQDDAASVTPEVMAAQTAVYPQLDGYVRSARELEVCDAWNLPSSPPLLTEPLNSDIPTLILAGSYDPITPPAWGQMVAEGLSHSYYYEFPSAGHNVDTDNPCAQRIKVDFINNPTAAPDASCIANVPGASFVLPDEIAIAPGFYNSVNDIDIGNPDRGNPFLEFSAGASLILFLLVIGYLIIVGLVKLIRGGGDAAKPDWAARLLPFVAGLTAVIAWALLFLISNVNSQVSHTDLLTLYFGLPAAHSATLAITVLIPLFITLTVGLLILTASAWIRGNQFSWTLTFFTLVALVAVFYSGLMVRWDLHSLLFS